VRVRIIRQANGSIDGIGLACYRVGCTYDISSGLAEYLVLEGYAVVDMRRGVRSPRPRKRQRRKNS